MKLPKDNLNYPVKITIGNSSGSGFLVMNKNCIYLVTAKHVVYQENRLNKQFQLLNNNLEIVCHSFLKTENTNVPGVYIFDFTKIEPKYVCPHQSSDVLIIKFGELNNENKIVLIPGIIQKQKPSGDIVYYDMTSSRKFLDTEITNSIYVLGYPTSISTNIMNQIDYNTPLVRSGIIAGKNLLNKTLILDCPVYGGNSGGLVLEVNQISQFGHKFHLIGVIVQFVPFIDSWQNTRFSDLVNINYQNSGYSVALPVDYIYELIEIIELQDIL